MATSTDLSQLQQLLDFSVKQGKTFLLEMGDFYPYATIIKPNGGVTAYGLYEPETEDLSIYTNKLESLLNDDLQHGRIIGYCSGLNVRARLDGFGDIIDAIQLKVKMPTSSKVYYLPYRIDDETISFGELEEFID